MKSNIQLNSDAIQTRLELREDILSPIDIFSLINSVEDCTLVLYPMSERISGMCIKEGKSKIIAVNSKTSYGRQRFTVAHELYHLLHEKDLKGSICDMRFDGAKPDNEKEADMFASYLLAPYDAIEVYITKKFLRYKSNWTLDDVIEMEQYFQISHQAMLKRLVMDNYLTQEVVNSFEKGIKYKAKRLGFDDKLYCAAEEEKEYFSIGEYIKKVQILKNHDLISDGKYDELLLAAFRADIVYNLGGEDMEIDD